MSLRPEFAGQSKVVSRSINQVKFSSFFFLWAFRIEFLETNLLTSYYDFMPCSVHLPVSLNHNYKIHMKYGQKTVSERPFLFLLSLF